MWAGLSGWWVAGFCIEPESFEFVTAFWGWPALNYVYAVAVVLITTVLGAPEFR